MTTNQWTCPEVDNSIPCGHTRCTECRCDKVREKKKDSMKKGSRFFGSRSSRPDTLREYIPRKTKDFAYNLPASYHELDSSKKAVLDTQDAAESSSKFGEERRPYKDITALQRSPSYLEDKDNGAQEVMPATDTSLPGRNVPDEKNSKDDLQQTVIPTSFSNFEPINVSEASLDNGLEEIVPDTYVGLSEQLAPSKLLKQSIESDKVSEYILEPTISQRRRRGSHTSEDSVISDGPSLFSTSSFSSVSSVAEVEGAFERLIEILFHESTLSGLYHDALIKMSMERLERNLRRLLKSFSKELRQEAKTTEHRTTATFIRSRARNTAHAICRKLGQDRRESPNTPLLEAMSSAPDEVSDEDSSMDETDDPVGLEQLERFVMQSRAFEAFRSSLRMFIYPKKETIAQSEGAPQDEVSASSSETTYEVNSEYQNMADLDLLSDIPQNNPATNVNRPLADSKPSFKGGSFCNNGWWQKLKSASLSMTAPNNLPEGTQRLEWIVSHDDFQVTRPGAVAEYAHRLVQAGYIKYFSVSNQASSPLSVLALNFHNIRVTIQNMMYRDRASAIPLTNSGATATSGISLQDQSLNVGQTTAEPSQLSIVTKYLWLHMCLKDRPYARIPKLQLLQVCREAKQDRVNDREFFSALKKKYYSGRTWKDKVSFKLEAIEFVEFTARAAERVDLIISPKLPPNIDDYEFFPEPPPERNPPCGPEYMAHLVTSCGSELPPTSVMFVQQVPKKKGSIVTYQPNKYEENIGYGLRFVEKLNTGLAVTVLFLVMLVTSVVFAIVWTILEKDIQGAFGVAAYITAVVTMGTVAWQMWETAI